ncbi:heme-containing dehydratase protein [Rutstroemia sp. NJR-2017a BVV2]|nr:heme-containing dehydratase protein [Rutstroemia sp. NJR-2017a BVV2]
MVFLADTDNVESKFTYAIFGIQYESLTPTKTSLISTLHGLLSSSAGHVDTLGDEDHGVSRPGPKTTTFVAYWLHSEDYDKLSESQVFKNFWDNLADDAGVWREVMTVPRSRYMFAASQNINWGLASMLDLKPSTDEGYWGVYRHRLSETPDSFTDPTDTFTSPYVTTYKPTEKPSIDIPRSFSTTLLPGRVKVRIPDNLCFVREGQRQRGVPADEREDWIARVSPHARSWITHLDEERNKNGVISFSTHVEDSIPGEKPSEDAETDQLAYFLDLAHFELAGRSHRGHVTLRKTVMELYGPGGKWNQGKSELFVELCVLKSGDLVAEYIGCAEGTGLLFLRDL